MNGISLFSFLGAQYCIYVLETILNFENEVHIFLHILKQRKTNIYYRYPIFRRKTFSNIFSMNLQLSGTVFCLPHNNPGFKSQQGKTFWRKREWHNCYSQRPGMKKRIYSIHFKTWSRASALVEQKYWKCMHSDWMKNL